MSYGAGKGLLKNYLHFCTASCAEYITGCLERCFLNISALVGHLREPTTYLPRSIKNCCALLFPIPATPNSSEESTSLGPTTTDLQFTSTSILTDTANTKYKTDIDRTIK